MRSCSLGSSVYLYFVFGNWSLEQEDFHHLSLRLSVSLYTCLYVRCLCLTVFVSVCLSVCVHVSVVGSWSAVREHFHRLLVPVNRGRPIRVRLTHYDISQRWPCKFASSVCLSFSGLVSYNTMQRMQQTQH